MSRVSEILSRRGPDQINSIDIENFLAFHSRLIVQGNENDGIQPMLYEDIVILFNGNLYNKESLKLTLESKGYLFKGISDTEVVAASIHQWGNLAFEKFNGFFSIVCFNTKSKSLTLARDRLGQKPMYYLNNGKSVFFGSTENLIPKNFLQSTRKESFIDFIVFGSYLLLIRCLKIFSPVNPGSYVEFSIVEERIISTGSTVYWKPIITNEINDLESAIELISDSMGNSTEEGLDASIDVACLFSGELTQVLFCLKQGILMMIFMHLLLILEEMMMPNLDQKPWQRHSDITTTLLSKFLQVMLTTLSTKFQVSVKAHLMILL